MGSDSKTIKAFVSYSWDSPKHSAWVVDLVNKLRDNEIDADVDQFIAQEHTVNLNQMMIQNIQRNDYVILVLTENYANRANSSAGGVGFETLLSIPELRSNPDKFILILRSGEYTTAFPFHLKDYYAIDFRNDNLFEENFDTLLRRIYNAPKIKKHPLGKRPVFDHTSAEAEPSLPFSTMKIPFFKQITDQDKRNFMNLSYRDIVESFGKLFNYQKHQEPSFDYSHDKVSTTKSIFELYVNGTKKAVLKVWLSHDWSTSIKMAYGPIFNYESDSSYNEMIICELNNDKELKLKMTMNLFSGSHADTPEKVVAEVWSNQLLSRLK